MNLNEPDHPINIIVKKFSDIVLWNVNEKKNYLVRTSKRFDGLDNIDKSNLAYEYQIRDIENERKTKNIRYQTGKKHIRATYDR